MHARPPVLLQVTYLVSLSSVGDLKARGPGLLKDMVGWVSAPVSGGLSAGFYPIKCSLGLSFYEQTTGTVLMPIIILAMYVGALIVCSAVF